MILEILKDIDQTTLLSANIGIEKENIRTDTDGYISCLDHPSVFGDKSSNEFITTDFAESQLEMITQAQASPSAALKSLTQLHKYIIDNLQGEFLWPYSLPPILYDDNKLIKIAEFKHQPESTHYRNYLAEKYGKRKQLLSGIHYNFSFSDELMNILQHEIKFKTARELNDEIYMKLARYCIKHNWLIVYLFGASSVIHKSYSCCSHYEQLTDECYWIPNARSFRNGINGYHNLTKINVSYNSLSEYIADIRNAINSQSIIGPQEYYSPVRLKTKSKQNVLENLTSSGIEYIEVRSLDLNPMYDVGIGIEALEFLHLLMIYALASEDMFFTKDEYKTTSQFNQDVADGKEPTVFIQTIDNMLNILNQLNIPTEKLNNLSNLTLNHRDNTATIIAENVKKHGYVNYFQRNK